MNNNQLEFIKSTKGLSKLSLEEIVSKAILIPVDMLSSRNMTNYAINVFEELLQENRIDHQKDINLISFMKEINSYQDTPRDFTLFNWLIAKIQWSNVDGLVEEVI